MTPVAAAAGGGHLEVVRYLAKLGAPIDASDSLGRTPLYDAVRGGHRDTVDFLLREGANASAQTTDYETTVMAAAEQVRILLKSSQNICKIRVRKCDLSHEFISWSHDS